MWAKTSSSEVDVESVAPGVVTQLLVRQLISLSTICTPCVNRKPLYKGVCSPQHGWFLAKPFHLTKAY